MLKYNYVINLKRRPDRWDRVKEIISNSAMRDNIFIKFEAFDGSDAENEILRFNASDNVFIKFLRKHKIVVTKGYLGCHLSHLFLYKAISENNDIGDDEYVGIYEDDFFLANNFDENYKKLLNTDLHKLGVDIMYLGGRYNNAWKPDDMKQFENTESPNVFLRKIRLKEQYNFEWERTTHAYIVKKSICAEMYKVFSQVSFCIWKGKLSLRAIDHSVILFDKWFKMYDWFPHLYYSPMNYDSNIQGVNLTNFVQLDYFK